MIEKIFFMWIFLFSVSLLFNLAVVLTVNYIIWCMIDDKLQIKI